MVAVVLVVGIGLLLRRVNADRARGRPVTDAPDKASTAAAPKAPSARHTPTWRADLDDDEDPPSGDRAYKADPLQPDVDTADQWARIDFDEIRRALPDSTYWKMAFPTKDPKVLEEREKIRAGWNEQFVDVLDDPPRRKTFGGGIAHIITHSMHHRAQLLYMLRRLGVARLPEGDVFSWENDAGQ